MHGVGNTVLSPKCLIQCVYLLKKCLVNRLISECDICVSTKGVCGGGGPYGENWSMCVDMPKCRIGL